MSSWAASSPRWRRLTGREMAALFKDLRTVNDFRNTRVAHIEAKLDDVDQAWQAMHIWLRCVKRMADMVV